MSHSTVMVVIPAVTVDGITIDTAVDAENALEDLLEPFNENRDVTPYEEEADPEQAAKFYRDHPEHAAITEEDPDRPGLLSHEDEKDPAAVIEWTRRCVGCYYRSSPEDGIYHPETGKYGYLSTYNPDSKWDWYALGGRWNGFFMLKPKVEVGSLPLPDGKIYQRPVGDGNTYAEQELPNVTEASEAIVGSNLVFGNPEGTNVQGKADLARKRDIDFDAMRSMAAAEAELSYDKFEHATQGLAPAPRWSEFLIHNLIDAGFDPDKPHEEIDEEEGLRRREVVDATRDEYASHPWVKALSSASLTTFFGENRDTWKVDDGGREAFVKDAREHAVGTFAMLVDGVWHEQGRMGWWGMASNEKDPELWSRQQTQLIDAVPDDAWLAIVDVHI